MQTAQEQSTFEAQFHALRIVSRMAYEYVDNLQPGDRFILQAEAAKHFDVASEGYNLFINCVRHQMRNMVMDVDAERRIVSIVCVKH